MYFREHELRDVSAISDKRLVAQFKIGSTKIYDMNPLIKNHPAFKPLEDDSLFFCVVAGLAGSAAIWNNKIDLSCEELWENGQEVKTPFDRLMSFADATLLWGLNESTLRKAVAYGKLVAGIDAKKFGKQWVVTIDAMKREYGEPVMDENALDNKSFWLNEESFRPFPA